MLVNEVKMGIKERWRSEGGYREVLLLALPLIISTGSLSIQHFIDRMFLTWHSAEAVASATPAGMFNFTIMCFFFGIAGYVSTFVAQYYGAGQYNRIGPILWQGIYIACIGGVIHLLFIPFAGHIFSMVGHDSILQQYEARYFRILCLGAAPAIASSSMAGFFSGRGKTWYVMWVNVFSTSVNIILDYALIFGNMGLPELGIAGAAVATNIAMISAFLFYLVLITRKRYRHRFHTLSGWRFDKNLFGRLLRFGFPNGVQFFLDIAGYTIFIMLIGRLGTIHLAATNIAFNINTLAFLPTIGFGMAVSILVGQKIGENKPEIAERSVYAGFFMTLFYVLCFCFLYVVTPDIFLQFFASHADKQSFMQIHEIAIILLRFVAFYSVFDAFSIIFAYAIKGAGDTRFVMIVIIVYSSLFLIIPSYLALIVFDAHIYIGWAIVSGYIVLLGITFFLRFLGGKWKSMQVIERIPPAVSPSLPETPFIELEL